MVSGALASGDVSIRRYEPSDRNSVLSLGFATGFFGSAMTPLLDRQDLFTRPLARYIDRFPELCFVAEIEDGIGGYVAGTSRDVTLESFLWGAADSVQDLFRLPFLSPKDRRYLMSRMHHALRALSGRERVVRTPRGPRLHVNLTDRLRGRGTGSRLLEALFSELKKNGVATVHANSYQTPRNDTSAFWARHGFEEYSRVRSTAWREVFADPVDLVCFARGLG